MRYIKITLLLIFIFSVSLAGQSREQYELKSISFEGNHDIPTSQLESVILSKETPWWFWKFLNSIVSSLGNEPVYFDSSNIPIDIEALEEFYTANGFFNSKIGYKYEVDTSAHNVYLKYLITEKAASFFGATKIIGLENLASDPKKVIEEDVTFDSTERYSQDILQEGINQSVSVLQNSGYMYARFDSTIIIKDTISNRADFKIYFTTGNYFVVDSILIKKNGPGENLVSEKLLRDIVKINPGEHYDKLKIKRNQLRLFRTDLFNSVTLSGVADSSDKKVNIQLDGNIGLLNQLSPEIIANNQETYFNLGLGASYLRKNFLGDARKLTVRSAFGIQNIFHADFFPLFQKFSFRDTTLLGYIDSRIVIEQPYLFGKPIFATWENYATINKRPTTNVTNIGSKLTFEFEFPSFTYFNFLSAYYNIEQTNEYYRKEINDSTSKKFISVLGADFGKTAVDNILFPTRGYNLSFQIEEANAIPYLVQKTLGSNFEGAMFYKILINATYYNAVDLKRNNIVAGKFKIGNLQEYKGTYDQIPINRTLFAGGSNSVRGWASNQLIPRENKNVDGLKDKGGTFLLESSLEYRYRVLKNIGVAMFFDAGNTWIGYNQFRFDEIAQAIGFGFRYYTSIAPFRIDFGLKFYDPDSKKYLWDTWDQHFLRNFQIHFGIGEAF